VETFRTHIGRDLLESYILLEAIHPQTSLTSLFVRAGLVEGGTVVYTKLKVREGGFKHTLMWSTWTKAEVRMHISGIIGCPSNCIKFEVCRGGKFLFDSEDIGFWNSIELMDYDYILVQVDGYIKGGTKASEVPSKPAGTKTVDWTAMMKKYKKDLDEMKKELAGVKKRNNEMAGNIKIFKKKTRNSQRRTSQCGKGSNFRQRKRTILLTRA